MKLVTFEAGGVLKPGVVVDDQIFDLNQLLTAAGEKSGGEVATVRAFLSEHGDALPSLTGRLEEAARSNAGAKIGAIDAVRLAAPITDPEKILCIGLNYNDHVAETGRALPTHPDIFAKFASSLIGPNDDIDLSSVTDNLDFEGELAIVIGKTCRNVSPEDAMDHVAGLMVLNDITARDLQYRGTQWLPGKAVDDSTPCGPTLVTLDEIEDPQALDIQTFVNGVEMQSSNTRYMIFPLRDLVAYASRFLALNAGDIITTGTPQGIGAKRNPPIWLQKGDVVEVVLGQVGTLRNTIV